MGECFTCEAAASGRYTMVLDADTVLEGVVMCEECRDSHGEVPWIEIRDHPVVAQDGVPGRASGATE